MKRWTPPAVSLLILAVAFAGCTSTTTDCMSTGPSAFAGRELRVLDHGAWDSAYAVLKPLFETRTGARLVQLKGEDAGAALQQAIQSKGNPVADVLYGVDNALFVEAARADVFEAYTSPAVSTIDTSVVRLDDFRHAGLLLATPVDHGYISVNYDAAWWQGLNESERPTTLRDLAEPMWASQLVVEDPRLSSPGLGFLVATVATFDEGDDYTYLDYWADLLRNGALVAKDWTEAYVVHFSAGYGQYEEGFAGDRSLVVSYTTSPAVEAYFGGGNPPSGSLEPEWGVFHQVEAAAILRCTDELPLAKAFIDLLLSREFQDQAAATMAVYPVVKGATMPDEFHANATAPSQLKPAPYTSATLERQLGRWLDEWTEVYQAHRA